MSFKLRPYHIRRYIALAVLPALLIGAAAYLWFTSQAKVYNATATLYVQQANNTVAGGPNGIDITGSTQLATNYAQMITDPAILTAAENSLRNKYPGYHIGNITATQGVAGGINTSGAPSPVSPLISITVSDSMPPRAADAANAVGSAFTQAIKRFEFLRFNADVRSLNSQLKLVQTRIQTLTRQSATCAHTCPNSASLASSLAAFNSISFNLLTYLEQLKVTRNSIVHSVNVFSPAIAPTVAAGPHATRGALLATVLAFLLCAGAVYVYDSLHNSSRVAGEVKEIEGAYVGRGRAL